MAGDRSAPVPVVTSGHWRVTLTVDGARLDPAELVQEKLLARHRSPARDLPRASGHLVGREPLLETLDRHDRLLGLHGVAGSGKTAILAVLADREQHAAPSVGAIYVNATGLGIVDLLRSIWDQIYVSEQGWAPTAAEMAESLLEWDGLVLIDDASATAGDLHWLADQLPRSRLRVASERPLLEPQMTHGVGGLDQAAAVNLLTFSLDDEVRNQPALVEIAELLEGHPASLLQAGALMRDRAAAPSEVIRIMRQATSTAGVVVEQLVGALSPGARELLVTLAIVERPGLTEEQLEQVTGAEPASITADCARLMELKLAVREFDRVRLVGGIRDRVEDTIADIQAWDRAADRLSTFLKALSGDPKALLKELGNGLGLFEWTATHRQWRVALTVSHVLEEGLVLYGRWECWRNLAKQSLSLAHELGDPLEEARWLHQLGSEAQMRGDTVAARDYLESASRLRAGHPDSLALTKHNQGLGTGAQEVIANGAGWLKLGLAAAGAFVIGAGLSVVVANAAPGTVGVSGTTVTASGSGATTTATTTVTTTITQPAGPVPVNLTLPDITFPSFTQAQVVPGTWDLQGATLQYLWQDCSTSLGCVNAGSGTTLDLTGRAVSRIRVLEVAANDACPQSCVAVSPERVTPSLT